MMSVLYHEAGVMVKGILTTTITKLEGGFIVLWHYHIY